MTLASDVSSATRLDDAALDRLFLQARTHHHFDGRPVPDALVRQLHELAKWGPTAFNCQPARFVFLRSPEAKQRLSAALSSSNREKTLAAPLTVLVGYDLGFARDLPRFTRSPSAQKLFQDYPALVEPTAMRSGTLQGAYLVLAARALGLDAGVLTGFDAGKLEAAFFPGGQVRINFVVNVGWGDAQALQPRAERYAFDEVAQIL